MGIKMNQVRCNGQALKISEFDTNKVYGNLKCCYCNANVSFVDSYIRDLGEKKVTVQKYFRLKRGQEHEQGCQYTVDGAILNIYTPCANEEWMIKQGDKFLVRLRSVLPDTIETENQNVSNEPGHRKRQHDYIPNGKKKTYLSTMNQIMKLRALVESNSDLENKISLQYYDWRRGPYIVLWKNFYFDSENENDYSRLLRYLTNGKVYHPICVAGYLKSVSEYKPEKFSIKLENVAEDENKRIAITVYFESHQIYVQLKHKDSCKIVIYADFKLYQEREWIAPDKKKFIFYNITGDIHDMRQLLLLSNDLTV